ncbi:MAG: PAS domain-containing protein [Flavobacteriales bacterium]|nr:PAS domain-containing protein [Flavobacteriales bacterium]
MKQQTKAIQILIFEDFHAETESLLRELQDAEMLFDAHVVSSVAEYEKTLFSNSPDVILSPYSLKGTNAVKLLGLARKHGIDAPFILLAFDLSEDIAIDLLAEGIEDYVQRSTIKRLPIAIKKALQRYKTQLELLLSEAKLRGSEASLQEAQKIAKIGSWEWEINSENIACSDEMFRIYGCEPQDFSLRQAVGFVHPKDKERVGELMVKGLTAGFMPVVEYTIIAGDGTVKDVRANAKPIKNENGDIIKVIGTLQDITERKAIENELLKNQGLLTLGEEISNSGSFELDLTHRKTRWSPNFYRITGIDPTTKITNKLFLSCIHPDDRNEYKKVLSESINSGNGKPFVYRLIRPDNGQVIHLQANGRRIDGDDKVIRWIGSVLDISDRILTQLELQRSEASLIEAQKIAKVGSWEWDVGTEQVWWSEEMYRIYETERSEITLSDVKAFIHPEDRERINGITQNDLNENITSVLEYRILLESGKVKYVTSSAKQVKDASGKVVRLIGTLQDVTDQIRSKEELKAQNLQKDLILNTAKVGIWHWKVNSDKLIWDERCAQVFESFSMEVDTEAFYNLIHPDDRDYVYQRLVDGLKKGEYSAEYRVVQNGKTSYVISRGRSTFGPDGKATRMDGIIIDMTERHLMENALRQSEQLFRDMAESITEVFWLTDWELNEVLYVSPQYEKLYGQSIQSLYEDPASWSRAIHPDDRDRVTTKFRQLAASGSYDEEYRLLMKDGTVKWVRDRAFPVFHSDGSVSRVAGITEDITEQKRAQVQVKTLSLVASETSNGVLIHDALGRITWANQGFTNITGYTAEEALGKEPWSFLSGPNTDHSLIEATYQKMKEGQTFKSDNVLVTKDGSEVWINTAFNPIMDEKGELNQVVSIGVDITQQKELELLQKNMLDELERTNQELRRRAAR